MDLRPPIPADKEFFTMGEASRLAQVPSHTLRYWESQAGLLRPARRSSGHRRYTREDLETIFRLKELIQRRKMTVAGARRALIELRKGAGPAESSGDSAGVPAATLKLLREVRKEIQALVSELGKS